MGIEFHELEPSMQIVRAIRELGADICAKLDEVTKQLKPKEEKALLSLRAAAKLLGVARDSTLKELIVSGWLKTVDVNGRKKIPAAEVERLAHEGWELPQRSRRRPKIAKRGSGNPAEEIRSIKI